MFGFVANMEGNGGRMREGKRSELPFSLCLVRPNTNYICAGVLMEFTQGPVATECSEVWLLFHLDLDEGV